MYHISLNAADRVRRLFLNGGKTTHRQKTNICALTRLWWCVYPDITSVCQCAPICILWQESHFLTASLYNIWLPVTVCMTSVNYLSYTLLFPPWPMWLRVSVVNVFTIACGGGTEAAKNVVWCCLCASESTPVLSMLAYVFCTCRGDMRLI